jgi:hypothetical protein
MTEGEPGKKVLLLELEPSEIDLDKCPGMTDKEPKAAMHEEAQKLRDAGYDLTVGVIHPKMAVETIEKTLSKHNFNCVLIGAGLRSDPQKVRNDIVSLSISVLCSSTQHSLQPMTLACRCLVQALGPVFFTHACVLRSSESAGARDQHRAHPISHGLDLLQLHVL